MNKTSNKSFIVHAIATICIVIMTNLIGFSQTNTYPIVGTGQTISYDTAVAITMPTSGQPFFGQNSNHPGNMRSYTNIGQIVQNGSFIEKTVIQTNNLATGVYLVKLQIGNTFEVEKLIKE